MQDEAKTLGAAQVLETQFGKLIVAEVSGNLESVSIETAAARLQEIAEGKRRTPKDSVLLNVVAEYLYSLVPREKELTDDILEALR